MRARLFPFSLLGRALQWFHSLPPHTVQNWESLMKEFMTEFYSPGKTQILRNKIATFAQALAETIAEAYERFNDYIRTVPHHKFSREDVVQKFYQGLTTASTGLLTHRQEDRSLSSRQLKFSSYSRRWRTMTHGHHRGAYNHSKPWAPRRVYYKWNVKKC